MSISASPVAAEPTTHVHALVPLRFPSDMRLTPVQFALLCAENREAVLELAADGQVLVMTPTGSETGARNSRIERPCAARWPPTRPTVPVSAGC